MTRHPAPIPRGPDRGRGRSRRDSSSWRSGRHSGRAGSPSWGYSRPTWSTLELVIRGERWAPRSWRLAVADYRGMLARRPRATTPPTRHGPMPHRRTGPRRPGEEPCGAGATTVSGEAERVITVGLGSALYRNGQFAEAAAARESNIPRPGRRPASTGCTWRCASSKDGARRPPRAQQPEAMRRSGTRASDEPRAGWLIQDILREAESVIEETPPARPAEDADR